jgi:hypothetical protein
MRRPKPDCVSADRLPILPRSHLYLDYDWEGDGPRFAGLFATTWLLLPPRTRGQLLEYWRTPGPARERDGPFEYRLEGRDEGGPTYVRCACEGPRIEYRRPRCGEGTATACCAAEGHLLRFRSDHLDKPRDTILRHVIVHELAHAHQWATGRFTRVEQDRYDLEVHKGKVPWANDADRVAAARAAPRGYRAIEEDAIQLESDWLGLRGRAAPPSGGASAGRGNGQTGSRRARPGRGRRGTR